jgi:hypothetical protein
MPTLPISFLGRASGAKGGAVVLGIVVLLAIAAAAAAKKPAPSNKP